jgi:hypothetical protein
MQSILCVWLAVMVENLSLALRFQSALARVETLDTSGWWFGRRREQRLQLGPHAAQGGVMFQQGFVNFRQPPEDGNIVHQLLAHLHKRSHYKNAHLKANTVGNSLEMEASLVFY